MSPTQVLDRRRYPHLTAVVLVFLALLVWGSVLELALLGWDTYPLIATSRLASLADLPSVLNTELMDGRYPLGSYWRPLVHLSFALDQALFGTEAFGYHATDLLLFTATGLSIATLARRLDLGHLGAAIAAAAWILHPAQVDVLTVPARRAETLAILFTCLAIVLALSESRGGGPSPGRRRLFVSGLFCAAALASKESGAIALPLVLGALLMDTAGSTTQRLRSLLASGWIPCLCFLAALAWRTAVLDGLGGSVESGSLPFLGALVNLPSNLVHYTGLVLVPGRGGHVLAASIALVLVALFAGRSWGRPALSWFLALWLLAAAGIAGASGVERDWYALPLVVPCALGLARGLIGALAFPMTTENAGQGKQRPMAWSKALAGGLLLFAWSLQVREAIRAPHATCYVAASDSVRELLSSFANRVEAAEPGTTVRIETAFEWDVVDETGRLRRRLHPIAPYGLLAYGELAFPEQPLELHMHALADEAQATAADVVRVLAIPRAYQVTLDR